MTAQQLIQQLQKLPPNMKIVIRGYEDGYNDILHLESVKIISHPGQKAEYYGEYAKAYSQDELKRGTEAVELHGENTKSEEYQFFNKLL